MREAHLKGKPWLYIGVDGKAHTTTTYSKPLSYDEAESASRMLVEGAEKHGRPIDTRIEVLDTKGGSLA
jgi:hypothetical protein